jgi:hypothetical protein
MVRASVAIINMTHAATGARINAPEGLMCAHVGGDDESAVGGGDQIHWKIADGLRGLRGDGHAVAGDEGGLVIGSNVIGFTAGDADEKCGGYGLNDFAG